MSPRRYLTAHRLDELNGLLREDDRAALATLGLVRVATGLQLQRLHHGSDDAAKQRRVRQLSRLSRWQVITRLPRRVGGIEAGSVSSIYCLDVAGQRLLNPAIDQPRIPWTPSTPFLAHALAVTELYVQLVLAARQGAIELVAFTAEPACWRHFTDRRGQTVTLKPDAHVAVGIGDFEHHWWVEIDRATESRPRLAAKALVYVDYYDTGLEQVRHDVFPEVLFVVPDDARADQVIEVLRKIEPRVRHLFNVTVARTAPAATTGDPTVVRRVDGSTP